nr:hypothetical protein [Tanacetum cinerariifolium]
MAPEVLRDEASNKSRLILYVMYFVVFLNSWTAPRILFDDSFSCVGLTEKWAVDRLRDMKIKGVGMETMKGVNSRGGRWYGNYQDRRDYGNYHEGGEYKNYQADHVFPRAWMLYYHQREVTIFEQYSISACACEFSPVALEQEVSCIAEKAIIVADMEERVNKDVIPANHMARNCLIIICMLGKIVSRQRCREVVPPETT